MRDMMCVGCSCSGSSRIDWLLPHYHIPPLLLCILLLLLLPLLLNTITTNTSHYYAATNIVQLNTTNRAVVYCYHQH